MNDTQRGQYDVIVVGAGLMGAATAWSLALRARSVLLLERFSAGHGNGSSHGSARIIRRGYNDALYTRLTGEALEMWQELERQTDARILRMLGGIDFGAARCLHEMAGHLSRSGVEHELLSCEDAEQLWPGMRFQGDVLFHPQAGTLDAALAVEAFVAAAESRGAEVRHGIEVTALNPGVDRAEVELATGEQIRAQSVVITAGAWVEPLVGRLVKLPPLAVTQQQIFHFPRIDAQGEPWPSVIHEAMEPIYHLAGGRDGGPGGDRKLAEHRRGTPTTAAGRSGEVDPASRARMVAYVKRWLPGLAPEPRSEATCLYTTTASEDFILDRAGPLVVCSACSGHGAKFAPVIGRMTAELAIAPDAAQIPSRFRLASHVG